MASFGDYVISYSGIMASQMALNIAGQNISNINSPGYTRRALDQATFVMNGSGLYRSKGPAAAGFGVMMNGISQLRDPYLDIRFRNEMTGVGSTDALLGGFEEIKNIINDVGKEGLTNQFQDLLDKIGKLNSNNVNTDEFDNLVKNSAESLCQLLNQLSLKLNSSKEDYEKKYDEELQNVNSIIDNIQKLNDQIKKADISGDAALELRDKRNVLIDELSQYMNIDVKYSKEDMGSGIEVEKLTITIPNENGDDFVLIDGSNAADIEKNEGTKDNPYDLTISAIKDMKGNVVNDKNGKPVAPNGDITQASGIRGSLQSMYEILTGKGEYADTANGENGETRGIPYYQAALDNLAKTFAEAMNATNTTDGEGNPLDPSIDGVGDLFETKDGSAEITAGNICISNKWRSGEVHMVASTKPNSPTTANDNIARFQNLFNKDFEFKGADGNVIYKGKFESFYANMQGTLGMDYQATAKMYETYAMSADELNNSRDSVSGVDLNQEGMNMMQYQKIFAASCRMMTTLDSLMDQVINRMGV